MPLTADRAKPAVPFAGIYRLIDLALSNVVNSGYLKVVVLTQYKSHSLDAHVTKTWRMSTLLGNYVTTVPAQQRVDKNWYLGSADAIFQSLNLMHDERPDIVVVVGADHVYRMDFSQMVEQHIESGAPCTVAAIRQPISLANQFGVIEVDDADPSKIAAFLEKPSDPKGLPDNPDEVLASMGNYVFTAAALEEAVTTDRDRGYWRDVGTIESYYDAHMDLISIHPVFNLYNYEWPIYTQHSPYPPAKFVHGSGDRIGEALNSAVSPGVVVSGAHIYASVLSPLVHVHSYASIQGSVLLDGVEVNRHAQIRRAIIDKNVVVPEGCQIGIDHEHDKARGFHVTETGIVVVGKGQVVTR